MVPISVSVSAFHVTVRAAIRAAAVALLLTGAALAPAAAHGQVAPVSPRVQSFAGAATDAIACGAEGLAANPAALARACAGPTRLLLLPTVKATIWASGGGPLWENIGSPLDPASLESELDPEVRREILESIGPDGLSHRQRLDLPLFQFTGRSVSGSLTFTSTARGAIARDLVELVLEGHDESRTQYSIEDTQQEAESYFTLALGHGRTVRGFDVGVTGHVMAGMLLTSWQAFDPEIDVPGRTVSTAVVGMFAGQEVLGGSVSEVLNPDGVGAGIDVGVMRQHGPFRFGVGVQNLLRWTSWSEELVTGRYEVVATPDEVTTSFETDPFDPATASPEERVVEARLLDDAHFPRRLRLGAGWEGPRASVGAGLMLTGDGRLDQEATQRLSLGAELRPTRLLRLQAGAATSGDGVHRLSLGAGVNLAGFNLDAAVSRLIGSGSGGYVLGVGLSLGRGTRP